MNAIHIYRVCFRVLVVVLLCENWRYTNIQFDVENKISLNFSGRERQTGCSLSLSLWSPVRHLAHYTTISNSSKRRKKERNSGKIARQFFISLRCGSVRFGSVCSPHYIIRTRFSVSFMPLFFFCFFCSAFSIVVVVVGFAHVCTCLCNCIHLFNADSQCAYPLCELRTKRSN